MVIRTKVMTENDDSSLESTLQAATTTTNTKSSRRTSWSKKRRDTTVVVFVTPPSKPQPSKPKQHRTTKEQSSSQSSVTTGSSSSSSPTSSSSTTSNGPFLQRLKSKLKKKPDPQGRKSQPAVPDDVEPATTTTTTTPPTAPRRPGVRFSEDVQWIAPCRFRQYLTCAEIQEQWYASPDFVRFKQEARVWAGQSSLYEDYYDLDSDDLTSGICYHYMMGHDLPDSAPATAATDSSWFPLVFSSPSTQTNDDTDNQKDEMTTAMDRAVETCLSVPCTASHGWWVPLLTADSSSSSSSSSSSAPPTESHAMLPVPS